jgi:hypothetical protein
MRVLFLADFFSNQINGGGENNDAVLITHLRDNNIEVTCGQTDSTTTEQIDAHDKIIVGNFIFLSPTIKEHLIDNSTYLIYEHDHKYVRTRDPSRFPNFVIPPDELVNVEFYHKAQHVVVLSQICKDIMEKNLGNTNVHSIGSSLWTRKKLEFFKNCNKDKSEEFAIVDSDNPTKGRHAAINFCQNKKIDFNLISSPDQYEFLQLLAKHETLIFIPQVLETYCRLVAEAKMLGCKVYTNQLLIGFMSEPYKDMVGLELINRIEEKVQEALEYFYSWISE